MDERPTVAHPTVVVEPPRESETKDLSIVRFERFSGPLPHPDLLRGYEEVMPGCADRILRMAEREGDHRRAMEEIKLKASQAARTRGQYLAFSLAFAIVLLGAYLINTGHPVSGYITLATAIVPLVTPYLLGRKEEKETNEAIAKVLRQLTENDSEGEGGGED